MDKRGETIYNDLGPHEFTKIVEVCGIIGMD